MVNLNIVSVALHDNRHTCYDKVTGFNNFKLINILYGHISIKTVFKGNYTGPNYTPTPHTHTRARARAHIYLYSVRNKEFEVDLFFRLLKLIFIEGQILLFIKKV